MSFHLGENGRQNAQVSEQINSRKVTQAQEAQQFYFVTNTKSDTSTSISGASVL